VAGVSDWLIALTALLPALACAIWMAGRGAPGRRLAAVQLGSAFGALMLGVASFAFAQASSMDLALTLGLLSLPATLLFAVFLERWL
jgi:multisubunit Na+/H+ antiporter MnhF subunit